MELKPHDIGEIVGQLRALRAVVYCVCEEVRSTDTSGEISVRIIEQLEQHVMRPRTDLMSVDTEQCHYADVRANNGLLEDFLDLFSRGTK